ncbi:MAG: type II toxin-antitoxin system RelE/ParE family toxin [Rhizobiales bacterium]|nr:type II toxin-antitoxin system RelE/ParE family toxin [Hyphomicrobiales bacterium]
MKVVFTDEALRDLDDILTYITLHYPGVLPAFELRLRAVFDRLTSFPESAQEVLQRPGVRMVPLLRYPYKIFYQVSGDRIEVLHIHHGAQQF